MHFNLRIVQNYKPLGLNEASYHPQNKFFWFHSLSPCLTITTLYLAIVFRKLKIGNLEILKSSNELLKVN
jgi:hypothetical protein